MLWAGSTWSAGSGGLALFRAYGTIHGLAFSAFDLCTCMHGLAATRRDPEQMPRQHTHP